MKRGIYVNSQVHYLSVGADAKHQTLSHQAGTVDSNFLLTLGTAVTQSVGSCTPDWGGVGMNGAVFDQKIFFAFTGNPGCTTNKSTGMPSTTHLYVAAWDLTTGDFAKDANGAYLVPKDLGPVQHTDSYSQVGYSEVIDMASAAIVVFNNLLYVFADNGTYTSGDGVNWSSYPALSVGGTNMEPLDAITFYPADADPLIMIIYGNYTTYYSEYNSLYAATWNGQFGAGSVLNGQNIGIGEPSGSTYFNHSLGLFAGTASPAFTLQPGNNPPGFSAGGQDPHPPAFSRRAGHLFDDERDLIRRQAPRIQLHYDRRAVESRSRSFRPQRWIWLYRHQRLPLVHHRVYRQQQHPEAASGHQHLLSLPETHPEPALHLRRHGSPKYRHPPQLPKFGRHGHQHRHR